MSLLVANVSSVCYSAVSPAQKTMAHMQTDSEELAFIGEF